MSQHVHVFGQLTFEMIRSSVCSAVPFIKQKISPKICSHWNRIALTLDQVTRYCEHNEEVQLWFRSLPASMKGLAIHEQGIFLVVCNEKENDPLVRLKIILHELGHYLLHRRILEAGSCIRAGSEWLTDQFEKEASLFALMGMVPDDHVRTVCSKYEGFEDRVRHLVKAYAFTPQEAAVRLAAYEPELRNSSYQDMFDRLLDAGGASWSS